MGKSMWTPDHHIQKHSPKLETHNCLKRLCMLLHCNFPLLELKSQTFFQHADASVSTEAWMLERKNSTTKLRQWRHQLISTDFTPGLVGCNTLGWGVFHCICERKHLNCTWVKQALRCINRPHRPTCFPPLLPANAFHLKLSKDMDMERASSVIRESWKRLCECFWSIPTPTLFTITKLGLPQERLEQGQNTNAHYLKEMALNTMASAYCLSRNVF